MALVGRWSDRQKQITVSITATARCGVVADQSTRFQQEKRAPVSDESYSATLKDGDTVETVTLELIAGLPQKSLIRPAQVEGSLTDVVWELDSSADNYTYRPAQSEGYGEGGAI